MNTTIINVNNFYKEIGLSNNNGSFNSAEECGNDIRKKYFPKSDSSFQYGANTTKL